MLVRQEMRVFIRSFIRASFRKRKVVPLGWRVGKKCYNVDCTKIKSPSRAIAGFQHYSFRLLVQQISRRRAVAIVVSNHLFYVVIPVLRAILGGRKTWCGGSGDSWFFCGWWCLRWCEQVTLLGDASSRSRSAKARPTETAWWAANDSSSGEDNVRVGFFGIPGIEQRDTFVRWPSPQRSGSRNPFRESVGSFSRFLVLFKSDFGTAGERGLSLTIVIELTCANFFWKKCSIVDMVCCLLFVVDSKELSLVSILCVCHTLLVRHTTFNIFLNMIRSSILGMVVNDVVWQELPKGKIRRVARRRQVTADWVIYTQLILYWAGMGEQKLRTVASYCMYFLLGWEATFSTVIRYSNQKKGTSLSPRRDEKPKPL